MTTPEDYRAHPTSPNGLYTEALCPIGPRYLSRGKVAWGEQLFESYSYIKGVSIIRVQGKSQQPDSGYPASRLDYTAILVI